MIEVSHLTKRYGSTVAVQNLTFSVAKGEIVGFLGPNGAGKTTTMRILTGFMPPSEGTAKVGGYDVCDEVDEVRKRIGYLPENPPLYADMTVAAYLTYVEKLKQMPRQGRKEALHKTLEICGLTHVRRRIIGHLSKGYRQRVGLAQALIHDPDVLILDEPTIGLDPKQIIEIRQLVKSLSGNHTIILSTHILPEVTMLCQRIIIINEGKIAAIDTEQQLKAQMRTSEKTEVVLKRPDPIAVEEIKKIPGVINVFWDNGGQGRLVVESEPQKDVREALATKIVERKWGLLEMKPVLISLEDIFLKLTTEEKEVNLQ